MKVFVFDKYSLITVVLVILLVITVAPLGLIDSSPASSNASKLLPIYSVATDEKVVSITFDAAWNADDIDDIINILNKYNCKSTFFVVGDWLDKYPEAAKKLSDAGHEISNHSNKHSHYNSMTIDNIKKDMDDCDAKIMAITGKNTNLFRAPYGEYNNNVVKACNETGRYCIQWDLDSLDWKNLTTAQMKERILPKLQNGSIILFHNGTKNTAAALPEILESIVAKGYSFKPVGEIIHRENYSINHEGRQIKK